MGRPTKEQIKEKILAKKTSKKNTHNPESSKEQIKEEIKEDVQNKNIDINIPDSDEKAPEFNEYDGNVEHKNYDDLSAEITGGKTENINIPTFIPKREEINIDKPSEKVSEPSVDGKQQTIEQSEKLNVTAPKEEPEEPYNPALKDSSKKEAQEAAERFADKILSLYAYLHTLAYLGLNLEDEKLKKRAMKGKFDMDCLYFPIPISDTETMTAKEWLDSYNRGLRKTLDYDIETGECVLSEKFINEVRPPMVRIFTAHGIGMTDGQAILFGFCQDIFEKSAHIVGLRLSVNALLKGLQELKKEKISSTPPPPETPQPQPKANKDTPIPPQKNTTNIKDKKAIEIENIQNVTDKEL